MWGVLFPVFGARKRVELLGSLFYLASHAVLKRSAVFRFTQSGEVERVKGSLRDPPCADVDGFGMARPVGPEGIGIANRSNLNAAPGKGLDVFGRTIFTSAIACVLGITVAAQAAPITSGSAAYSNSGLTGTVDYEVYATADVPAAYTGIVANADPGKAIYIYTVNNTGPVTASAYQVLGIGQYDFHAVDASNGGAASSAGVANPTNVFWNFDGDGLQVENSQLLWLQSDKLPSMSATFSIVFDTGTTGLVTGIAVPGTTDIPEPASLALMGLGALAIIRRRK